MLPHGSSGKEGKDDEADGVRLQSILLPFSQPLSTSAGKQISDKAGKLDQLLTRPMSNNACDGELYFAF